MANRRKPVGQHYRPNADDDEQPTPVRVAGYGESPPAPPTAPGIPRAVLAEGVVARRKGALLDRLPSVEQQLESTPPESVDYKLLDGTLGLKCRVVFEKAIESLDIPLLDRAILATRVLALVEGNKLQVRNENVNRAPMTAEAIAQEIERRKANLKRIFQLMPELTRDEAEHINDVLPKDEEVN